MKRYQILLPLTVLLLVACIGLPVHNQDPLVPDSSTITPTIRPTQTSTPTPTVIGTWEMVIEGVIFDQSTGKPISGAISNSMDNSFEIVEFTNDRSGRYTARVTYKRWDGSMENFTIAWLSMKALLTPKKFKITK